jgi:tRNA nucleotidyltransferase (CCA-adding enzyme)
VQLWFARSAESKPAKEYYALARAAKNALDRGDPIAAGELAVGGAELMAELGLPPGKQIGQLLAALLDAALADPGVNTREALVARARQLVASGSAR